MYNKRLLIDAICGASWIFQMHSDLIVNELLNAELGYDLENGVFEFDKDVLAELDIEVLESLYNAFYINNWEKKLTEIKRILEEAI